MTISTQTFRFSYTSTGGTVYPYTNKILSQNDLKVYVNSTLQTIGTHYTVSGVGTATGGNVTFLAAPAVGAVVLITKDGVEFTQETDYVENDTFPASSHEDALDKLTNIAQKIWDYTRRSLKIAITSTLTDLELPTPEAGKVLGWNGTADALLNLTLAGTGAVSDEAYSSATWDGITAIAPSKNAVRDALNLRGMIVNTQALFDSMSTVAAPTEITLAPGAYTVSANMDASTCVSLYAPMGVTTTIASGITLTINGKFKAGPYKVFNCVGTGKIVYAGKKLPEWWGAVDDSGTTDNTVAIQAALTAGGEVEFLAPNGGYYGITDVVNATVAGTKIYSNNRAEIVQATATKGGIVVTVSNVEISGLKLTGPQHAAYSANEKAIYAYGTDNATRIENVSVTDCDLNSWGGSGVYGAFIDGFKCQHNHIYDICYAGIWGLSTNDAMLNDNHVYNITPGTAASGLSIGIAVGGQLAAAVPKRVIIADNIINSVTYEGILAEPAQYATISGNVVIDCKYGISVQGYTGTIVSTDVAVTGNSIINLTLSGADVLVGLGAGGVDAANPNLRITYDGNIVYGYGYPTGSTGAVQLRYNNYMTFTNNTIDTCKYAGINSFSNDNVMIVGNTITNLNATGATGGMQFATTATSGLVVNNRISTTAAIAIRVDVDCPGLKFGKNDLVTTNANPFYDTAGAIVSNREFASHPTTYDHTGTTDETTLKSLVIGQNTMLADEVIRVTGSGTKSGAGGNKTIKLYFGATAWTVHAAANNANDWRLVAEIMNARSLTTQYISWSCWDGTTITQGWESAAIDTTAATVVLKTTGTLASVGDHILQSGFIVERKQ